ncbi:MAG: hypothetical protein R3181_10475 [Rubricoccaceae bacterium]|nr:hypothetical protein [Rubricoccaceae bacterium]
MNDRPIVTGVFHDPEDADRAYRSLRERGYTEDDIHVVMSDATRERLHDSHADALEIEHGNKAAEGAGTGAAVGGTIGGIVGALAAVGANVVVPGLGLAVAGPLAGALAGAGAGGATGTLVGALIGAGIPEERAKLYESSVNDGGIVVGAHTKPEDRDYYADTFRRYNGRDVHV